MARRPVSSPTPVVQPWTTGCRRDRHRMAVASVLVKDLRIDQRTGEAWLRGAPDGADVANKARHYVPRRVRELAQLRNDYIHRTWTVDATALTRAGAHLGAAYARRIVDRSAAHNRALALFERFP
jgi:deoxyribodipyrimidine photo-lyase